MARDLQRPLILLTVLVVTVVAVTGALVTGRIRQAESEQALRSLAAQAALAREIIGDVSLAQTPRAELDALADRAGTAAGARVTLISPDGAVVGDSEVPLARMDFVENHADRPEIRKALAGRTGYATRRSRTVGRPLRYVALRLHGGAGGVVRVATEASSGLVASNGLWRDLAVAAALGLLLAVGGRLVLARSTRGPLHELQRLTEAIADGDLDHRLPGRLDAELGGIAASIQRLAEQLRERLGEVTEEKERLRAVLDGMSEGVLVIDPKGEIVLANDRVRSFFGVSGALEGGTVLAGIRNADLSELLATASRSTEALAREIEVSHPEQRTFRVHAVRFPAGAATPVGTVAVFHDVTELTQLETMRREFVANASHELRTPLAAIRGFAETLLKSSEISDRDRNNYLEVIDRNAERLANLVADLLALSKIESGKTEVSSGPVDLAALTESLLRENRTRLEERRVDMSHTVAGDTVAWADASAVEQVLTNLLDNAIQYTEPGGEIRVSIAGDDARVRVVVQDTGIGIPKTDLARIFERFYRVDKARSRALGGTGLGLAIVKHLLQNMDGEISAESRLGEGSRFTFTLPRE